MLILRGLSWFCLVLAGECPVHIVELEGLVPCTPNTLISALCKIGILLCH